MQVAYAYSTAYTRTHSVTFLTDNLLNTLREVVRENGLSPERLMQDRDTLARGIRTWLDSGHLTNVIVEFFRPGATTADARWEFPVSYSGSGVDEDMWLDKNYLRQLIAKAKRPSSDCNYRVVLWTNPGAGQVDGFSSCSLLSTGSLVARHAGTAIATGHLTAGVTYWK
jgi:hypothetical protein